MRSDPSDFRKDKKAEDSSIIKFLVLDYLYFIDYIKNQIVKKILT